MLNKREQYSRYLGEFKLLQEADPQHVTRPNVDGLTFDQRRYLLNLYRMSVDRPQNFRLFQKFWPWLSRVLEPFVEIGMSFKKLIRGV